MYEHLKMDEACRRGDLEAIKLLVVQDPTNIKRTDAIGITPLHRVAAANHLQIARFLVAHGANVIYIHVYVCMYVCMYAYIYIYTYLYIYVCMFVCMYVCMHVYIYIYICTSCDSSLTIAPM